PDEPREILALRFEYLAFGPGRVIFGELGDFLEQPRSRLVVEPARGHGLGLLRHAGEHIGAEIPVDAVLVAFDQLDALPGHHAGRSRARRRPVKTHRWWG